MRDPLETTDTEGSFKTVLQYFIISPKWRPRIGRKGSPPLKLIFSIPQSFSSFSPRFAMSKSSINDVLAVWKQNPHS
jgi:hypothetical protein